MRIGLFWFDRDLRLHDHPALSKAAREVDYLLCVYVDDTRLSEPSRFVDTGSSNHRKQFLNEGLNDLYESLAQLGQRLHTFSGRPEKIIEALVNLYGVSDVYRSQPSGHYEIRYAEELLNNCPTLRINEVASSTLLNSADLPFSLDCFPETFSKFRRAVEPLKINPPEATVKRLPPPPVLSADDEASMAVFKLANSMALASPKSGIPNDATDSTPNTTIATGGEKAGLSHLREYFKTSYASLYKEQRNDLSAWSHSTKFSLWLAQGSISVREIVDQLHNYERREGANESTYWIVFELLWREFFFWHARVYGARLFAFKGVKNKRPLTSAYAERIMRWTKGTTPFPLVNALMNELATTGYMSNRGRQIAASCLIHELSVDWRFGAAYFEQQLIDYDVGSNWGNWQYIAGVGTDTRDVRRFNIEKQTQTYDPDGTYRRRWLPEREVFSSPHTLHSVDAADWPIA